MYVYATRVVFVIGMRHLWWLVFVRCWGVLTVVDTVSSRPGLHWTMYHRAAGKSSTRAFCRKKWVRMNNRFGILEFWARFDMVAKVRLHLWCTCGEFLSHLSFLLWSLTEPVIANLRQSLPVDLWRLWFDGPLLHPQAKDRPVCAPPCFCVTSEDTRSWYRGARWESSGQNTSTHAHGHGTSQKAASETHFSARSCAGVSGSECDRSVSSTNSYVRQNPGMIISRQGHADGVIFKPPEAAQCLEMFTWSCLVFTDLVT